MNYKKIIELGLLLPILTIVCISSVYYFEVGYFRHFGIPFDFIEFDLVRISHVLFIFLPTILFFAFILEPIKTPITIFFQSKTLGVKIFAVFMFIGLLAFFIYDLRGNIFLKELNWLWFSLFFGLVLLLNKYSNSPKIDRIYDDFSVFKIIAVNLGDMLGPLLVVGSVTCIIMFHIGRTSARSQPDNIRRIHSNSILLKRNPTFSIYGIHDSTETEFNKFIIFRSNSDIDTICVCK